MLNFMDINYINSSDDDLKTLFSIRKKIFKDRLDWLVNDNNGLEFDKYDNVNATYILGKIRNSVICGVRLIDMANNNMIEDIFYQFFGTVEEITKGNGMYLEASRLFVDKETTHLFPLSNQKISFWLFLAMVYYARSKHYDGYYAVVSHPMLIILKRSGWKFSIIKKGISEKKEAVYLISLPVDEKSTYLLCNRFKNLDPCFPFLTHS